MYYFADHLFFGLLRSLSAGGQSEQKPIETPPLPRNTEADINLDKVAAFGCVSQGFISVKEEIESVV